MAAIQVAYVGTIKVSRYHKSIVLPGANHVYFQTEVTDKQWQDFLQCINYAREETRRECNDKLKDARQKWEDLEL